MIYIRTQVYNAEKTLKRAVDSILNQTYSEFTYYLLDNGSTDKTGEIIRQYAEKDARIVPFYNIQNYNFVENPDFWSLSHKLQDNDFLCFLDADDAYEPTFLEEMLKFLKENQLDIAACGTRFIDEVTGEIFGGRILPENMILKDARSFDYYFTEIHWNLRQVWGKLYTAKAIRARYEIDKPEWFPKAYGGDTINVYECVKAANAIGVYAKTLHSYYMSPKSISHKWIDGREDADEILFDKSVELLQQKCGFVSEKNLNFLYVVYYNALNDTFPVLFQSDQTPDQKLLIAGKIMGKALTKKMLQYIPSECNRAFLETLTQNLLNCAKEAGENGLDTCRLIFSTFTEKFAQLITRETFPMYLKECPQIVKEIALAGYQPALDILLKLIGDANEDHTRVWLELGLNLAAVCEDEEAYVALSKKIIVWNWNNGYPEEAKKELQEWLQILPEDEELQNMEKILTREK